MYSKKYRGHSESDLNDFIEQINYTANSDILTDKLQQPL